MQALLLVHAKLDETSKMIDLPGQRSLAGYYQRFGVEASRVEDMEALVRQYVVEDLGASIVGIDNEGEFAPESHPEIPQRPSGRGFPNIWHVGGRAFYRRSRAAIDSSMKRSSGVVQSQEIALSVSDLREVLKDIEVMLQSLHRVGSFYSDDLQECDRETIRIIDGFGYTKRLARVRYLLTMAAHRGLSAEEVERLEETLGRVRHWRPPKQKGTGR